VKCRVRQSVYEELEEIWQYSLSNWGIDQADQYIRDLTSRFEWLAENPQAGKQRDDIKPGYYCFPQGSHLIFYRTIDDTLDILGVPHQSMDVESRIQ
jgi:toxin ParE1/3/4